MTAWDDGYQLGLRNGLELGRRAERERVEEKQPRDAWLITPCRVCAGTTSHVLGCPEMDKPR